MAIIREKECMPKLQDDYIHFIYFVPFFLVILYSQLTVLIFLACWSSVSIAASYTRALRILFKYPTTCSFAFSRIGLYSILLSGECESRPTSPEEGLAILLVVVGKATISSAEVSV